MIALVREVPAAIAACELTHLSRTPIDVARARAEHALYVDALRQAGLEVRDLARADDLPDAVFVEDTAIVLDEVAIISRPGAPSRRAEVPSVREALAPLRDLRTIEAPATLDGGDVLVLGRDVVVGRTPRTNAEGVTQLERHLVPLGYRVRDTAVTGCLHLKSAVTRAGEENLVVNPAWVDPAAFPGWDVVPVHPDEPFGANVLWLGLSLLCAAAFPRTNERLSRGAVIATVPAGELAKAEGGLTCCSLLVGTGS
jgi:dimethylargininase